MADTPEWRRSFIENARLVMVVLCLHVFAFQIIAAIPILEGYEMSGNGAIFFLFFAGLYLALGVALGLDWRGGRILGFVLATVSVPLWVIILAMGQWGIGGLPRSGWFLALSVVESAGIVVGLLILHQVGRSLQTPAAV
jgi:hypothetical protein